MKITRHHFFRLLQLSLVTVGIITSNSTWSIEITTLPPQSNTFNSPRSPNTPANATNNDLSRLPSRSLLNTPASKSDDKIADLIAELSAERQTEHQTDAPAPEAPVGGVRAKLQNLTQAATGLTQRAGELAMHAMGMLGINYRRGGNTPETGLDCSGMVRYVYKQALGLDLPRSAAEISQIGLNIQQQDLQPGDLVFYNTMRRGFSHVGIYLGDNKFIHSPSAGGQVRIESMELAYWKKRFNGARHVNDKSGAN
jgi:cell wall-associated NlpC family hydrolase